MIILSSKSSHLPDAREKGALLRPSMRCDRAGSSSSSNGEPTSLVKSVSVLAKDFVVDKVKGALRRPTARDLIEEEDALALPQVRAAGVLRWLGGHGRCHA